MGENIDLVFETIDDALVYAKKIGATHFMQKYFVENKGVPGVSSAYKFADVKNGKYSFFDSYEEANQYYMDYCYKDDLQAYIEIFDVQSYLDSIEREKNNSNKAK